ncbi:MAG: imidazole glycerol phosphate synthase subunit HisH [Lachnospiraceae bacterium]|nr:imidazole glycerol phosphate synthase subunit HisH [Lachnospiraceae bacterium]
MVAVIDYDAGNIMSVIKAVEHLGHEALLTRSADEILGADHIILPGVGAFGDCMEKLRSCELEDVIKKAVDKGIPFMGICLGLQLIFEESEESPGVKGLGLLKGKIKKLPEDKGLKIPNIGWNSLSFPREGRLFRGIDEGVFVYFVHSYYLQAEDESIVTATTDYAAHIHASVEKDNVFACQFHPEKSSDPGLKMLDNFLGI